MNRAPHTTALLLCLLTGGCNVIGAVGGQLAGPPTVKARYTPPREPMLVLVENYHNPAATRLDAQRLGLRLTEELANWKIAPVIDPGHLESVKAREDFAKMPIEQVGRAARARQVLYVNLREFGTSTTVGADATKGRAEMHVRVVDAATGRTRWPTDAPRGYPVTVETPWVGGGNEVAVKGQLARHAAYEIVRLLRTWSPEENDLSEP